MDAAGDHPCLRLRSIILPGILFIEQKKLAPVRVLPLFRKRRELCARIKGRMIVILDPAKFPVHKLPENIIYAVQHFGAAAKFRWRSIRCRPLSSRLYVWYFSIKSSGRDMRKL